MSEFNRMFGNAVSGSLNVMLVIALLIFIAANFSQTAFNNVFLLIVVGVILSGVVGLVAAARYTS